jgi:hypothetical protein
MIKLREQLGICHYCGLPVPAQTINGEPSREGFEYKQVLGDINILWHFEHPLFPNCFRAESADYRSPFFDDPRRFAQDEPALMTGREFYDREEE